MEIRKMGLLIACTALGAAAGTLTIQHISQEILRHIMVVLLLGLFIYTRLARDFGDAHKPHRMPHHLFAVIFGLLIGFYDGFFGPGTGTFWTVAFVILSGLDLRRATGHTKVVNFTSNVVSLIFFIAAGQVLWLIGLIMGAGLVRPVFLLQPRPRPHGHLQIHELGDPHDHARAHQQSRRHPPARMAAVPPPTHRTIGIALLVLIGAVLLLTYGNYRGSL